MHNINNYLEKLENCIAVNSHEAEQKLSQTTPSEQPAVPGILCLEESSDGILGWTQSNPDKAFFLPAFYEALPLLPDMAFSGKIRILGENDIVFDGCDYYMLTNDAVHGLTLNRIAINGDENIITAIAEMRGYVNMEFLICKLYLIGRVKKYLTSMWIGYGEDAETGEPTIFFAPIFPEDVTLFEEYDAQEIAREGMCAGDMFIKNERIWQIGQDENGFYIFEPSPLMRIIQIRS